MKRAVFHYKISELTPYIDWSYFLHAWGISNSNRATADEVIADAKAMLVAMEGRYHTRALFALCNAKSSCDDLIIESTPLPLLRQQHCIDNKPNLCLSDFISPTGDKIGLFATSIDSTFGNEYRNDDYLNIIAQTLADRLAEATATLLHLKVRTDETLWGYAHSERLTPEQLNREEYQGIRPAVGYPSLPDQSVIFIIDSLLHLNEIGIELTPNGAMQPHASVCGLMLSHPAAHYFAVGKISSEQLHDYARRRGLPLQELKKFLTKNLQTAE